MLVDPDPQQTERALRAVVLPLLSVDGDGIWTTIASAFVIHASGSEALLVSAAHNLSHFLPRDRSHPSTPAEFRKRPPKTTHIEDHTLCVMVFENERHALAAVVAAHLDERLDIALMTARLPVSSPCSFTRPIALDTTPLVKSTPVLVVGYPRMQVDQTRDGRVDNDFASFDLPLIVRSGQVVEIDQEHPRRGPTARLSCAIDSGMSGGPVFDLRARSPYARAIARSDLSVDGANMAGGSGEMARCTLLWPTLAFPIPTKPERRVSDLIRDASITDLGDGANHVVMVDGNPKWQG